MTDREVSWIIDATPTKDFFIEMLVKDIPLERAIIDLVDNCVDGALRARGEGDFEGLWVLIELSEDRFRITDNCGGIPVELARDYAFRFGRPEGTPPTPRSVGQFGVGMKRAFFKLGTEFRVESTTEASHFVIEEDVEEWKNKEEWEFTFTELEEHLEEAPPPDRRGTIITISSLHKNVSGRFGLENFRTGLVQQLQGALSEYMERGLAISLNGIPLEFRPLTLLHSDYLQPAYREKVFNKQLRSPVTVRMYAGVSESRPVEAGWYVFCNGRMVLEANQENVTGWGEGGGRTIPKYHNQFARFRGYAFFESDDAGLLPWNTTKTGVDEDSPRFRAVRLEMIKLMRPVIDFLNKLDAEKDIETDERPLQVTVDDASSDRLSEVATRDAFLAPKPVPRPPIPRTGRIQYSKPVEQIKRVKRVLKVTTYKEVGEKTFDYFFRRECEE